MKEIYFVRHRESIANNMLFKCQYEPHEIILNSSIFFTKDIEQLITFLII
jgi:hypothetical protein